MERCNRWRSFIEGELLLIVVKFSANEKGGYCGEPKMDGIYRKVTKSAKGRMLNL